MSPTAVIVGSGNIGTDLMYKLSQSKVIEPVAMVGIDPKSEGLRQAAEFGLWTSSAGVDRFLAWDTLPDLVFEATSAGVHQANAPRYERAGVQAIDLTPAAIGTQVVPPVNLGEYQQAANLNLITCGGQATIPMVHAVSRVVTVDYAEIVASVASVSAGPGTRANIDEFTRTTRAGIETIGGVRSGKAIIVLNPADPPMIMRDTIFCSIPPDADTAAVAESVQRTAEEVAGYVPGYRLLAEPQFDRPSAANGGMARVAIFVEVAGAGDFLPEYAGNLDIMTAAAVKVGEECVRATESRTANAGALAGNHVEDSGE